ncbi:hypothetical protein VTN77DRAFT_8027 [Rasamsonia byssochlamydoides]|uniref:uncharacterized protein n=1 Tax=Rasamsonia byssochlamydoides TaxID=89139 RepID=UPI003744A614
MAEDDHASHVALPQLTTVAEKTLPAKCKPGLLAYCPTMDLVALATEDEQLRVFRLNGQQVLGANLGGDPYLDEDERGEARGISWKNDGHLLAVAGADNKIRIISSYSGKTVHHYSSRQQEEESSSKQDPKITCLGWGVNFTDSKAAQQHLQEPDGQLSAEDLLAPDTHPAKAAVLLKADLPRELALLDIESSLPKLSTLPGTGGDDDVFSSRASIDAIFHSSNKNSSDSVDVLFVGFNDGLVHLRIFDCFEIGCFSVSNAAGKPSSAEALLYASHPMSSTHALLLSEPAAEGSESKMKLLTIDLQFITKSGRYLSLLASKTTQLQNLLRYINQVQRQIQLEWKNVQDLPARYIRSVSDDLQEKCHCDFVTALYHLVVTGNCFPPLKEFLVDIVGERGHKRWEKTVSTGYENVRRLTHECLLPALERCEVLLSRLIGISKFHKLSHILGLETRDLQEIVDTVDCLHLLAHNILTHCSRELRDFLAFSKWLRHEIDMQTAEPMSQSLEELMEKSDMIDHGPTLDYIQGALTKSALRNFIHAPPGMPGMAAVKPPSSASNKWAPSANDGPFYETYRKMLAQQEQREAGHGDSSQPELPKLNDLIGRLGLQCDKVFGQIALTQRRGILHRCPLVLHSDCDRNALDMTMCYENVDGDEFCSIYVAAKSRKSPYSFYIYRLALNSVNGVSSTKALSIATLSLQRGDIRQIQFVQDNTIMFLHSDEGQSSLINFPFIPSPPQDSTMEADSPATFHPTYVPFDPSNPSSPSATTGATVLDLESAHAELVMHSFPSSGPKSKPVRIDVNGRKGRRAVCVLFADGLHYEVLDMDSQVQGEEEEEVQEGEENRTEDRLMSE